MLGEGKLRKEDIIPDVSYFAFYIDAFQELSTCRPQGFGIGPIPFTAIVEYAKIYNVEDFQEFLEIIRRMDSVWLELERQGEKNVNSSKNNSRKT